MNSPENILETMVGCGCVAFVLLFMAALYFLSLILF